MFDRRLLQCFDWGLLVLTLSIGGAGLVALYSAVSAGAIEPNLVLFKKQLIYGHQYNSLVAKTLLLLLMGLQLIFLKISTNN